MVTRAKDFRMNSVSDDMSGYIRPPESHLTAVTRVLGVCTAIVVCGVGVDVAYHRHLIGYYVTNEDSICSCCWFGVLSLTRGWRKALLYLPLSCLLAWKPHRLWLSFVAAGLLAVLSLLHVASSALNRRNSQSSGGLDSVGESLLNGRPESYDRFEEVLVTEVLDDGVSGPPGRMGDSDGEM
ncbi:uncharacterized protein LOC107264540 isoform X2 [Cephus cinctus]|uniref:Uncharacterized protein LOC107264540 isoform X2 n=1 Tax=Cephus cinctus TaxID=211228 RepID=A0AAJ7RBV7_CEPCN|nr:uncharacterized protein LOC107264540 isoform X2 [Cephus cinctus]